MTRTSALLAITSTLFAGTATTGCGATSRSVFHPTDTTFRPLPGPTPSVYLTIEDVPRAGMRSVGLIEVTVPESSGLRRAIELAAAKGRDVGCWILIEESIFATVQTRASLDHGATVRFAHGGGGGDGGQEHGSPGPSDGKLTAEFHCVVQATAAGASASAFVFTH